MRRPTARSVLVGIWAIAVVAFLIVAPKQRAQVSGFTPGEKKTMEDVVRAAVQDAILQRDMRETENAVKSMTSRMDTLEAKFREMERETDRLKWGTIVAGGTLGFLGAMLAVLQKSQGMIKPKVED